MDHDLELLSHRSRSVECDNRCDGRAKRSRDHESDSSDSEGSAPEECRRKRMRLALEERLSRSDKTHNTAVDTKKVKLQALVIEALLFQQAQTATSEHLEATDVSMDRQLQLLVGRVQRRRSAGTSRANTSPAQHRTMRLRDILGDQRYTHTRTLMHRIQTVGHALLVHGLHGGTMPAAVRQLFCATPLVTAWHHVPSSQLETVPWTTYIQQAEQNLEQYHAWNRHSGR